MKRVGMNDTENETVRFSMKPNPVLYALEFTRHVLLVWTLIVVIPSLGSVIYVKLSLLTIGVCLLITYVFVSLVLFIMAVVTACHLMFVVTDKRAIVRVSFGRMTTEKVSIAIEAVKRIEITSFGAAYSSVYLSYDKTLHRKESKGSEPDYLQSGAIRRVHNELTGAPAPIERISSIWGPVNISDPMNMWPRLFGFYGFKGFDEFANIISEQQRLRSEFQRGRSW
jgi:hypothetical protein